MGNMGEMRGRGSTLEHRGLCNFAPAAKDIH